ncbi:hypothetical protein [Ruicaihuangia caeni]|uniref:Protein kinase domain-containing protein n=1 Tax=Ruicaihuangia caeni TaxID=3042517 RepID=A0AAW6T9H3_9MICO|nr:hypothetical protein [Klugiella sp. YN-L-19]MDI2098010.1 hypothetical protein [Klugiella sp. YN-L-19]
MRSPDGNPGVLDLSAPAGGPLRTIGGYRVVGELGMGLRCQVLLGIAPGEAPVALKVPRTRAAAAAAEAELAVLGHGPLTRAVPLLDVSSLDYGVPVLVFDRLERGTLSGLLAVRGHLTLGEAVTVFAPIAAALAELHELGISHGAIDATHIGLDRHGAPYLLGWGSSRQTVVSGRAAAIDHRDRSFADRDALLTLLLESIDAESAASLSPPPRSLGDFGAWLHRAALAAPVDFERHAPGVDASAAGHHPHPLLSGQFAPGGAGMAERADAGGAAALMRTAFSASAQSRAQQPVEPVLRERVSFVPPPQSEEARARASLLGALLEWPDRAWNSIAGFRRSNREGGETSGTDARSLFAARLYDVRARWMALSGRSRILGVAGAAATLAAAVLLLQPGDEGGERMSSAGQSVESLGPDAHSSPVPSAPEGDPIIGGDDPVAAAALLLAARQECFREAQRSCLRAVVEPGSSAERSDALGMDQVINGGRPEPELLPEARLELVDDYGDSALVALRAGNVLKAVEPPAAAKTPTASVLMVRTEAGWRFRAYFDASE